MAPPGLPALKSTISPVSQETVVQALEPSPEKVWPQALIVQALARGAARAAAMMEVIMVVFILIEVLWYDLARFDGYLWCDKELKSCLECYAEWKGEGDVYICPESSFMHAGTAHQSLILTLGDEFTNALLLARSFKAAQSLLLGRHQQPQSSQSLLLDLASNSSPQSGTALALLACLSTTRAAPLCRTDTSPVRFCSQACSQEWLGAHLQLRLAARC